VTGTPRNGYGQASATAKWCTIKPLRWCTFGPVLTVENFAGVYSGRYRIADANDDQIADPNLDKTSEIGIVRQPSAIEEIRQNGVPGTSLSELLK